jgi:hypothetical protein
MIKFVLPSFDREGKYEDYLKPHKRIIFIIIVESGILVHVEDQPICIEIRKNIYYIPDQQLLSNMSTDLRVKLYYLKKYCFVQIY